MKMVLQLGQQIERLQAVDSQRFEKIVVRRKVFSRHLEVRRCEIQYFIQRLLSSLHSSTPNHNLIPNGVER